MYRGMTAIIYKEAIHIGRDPRTLFLMLLIPGIQLIIFGYAIDVDVRNINTVVYNLDGRRESARLIEAFENTGTFQILGFVNSDEAFNQTIVSGRARVGVKIPPDFSDRLMQRQQVPIQILIDGSDSTVAMQALNVANAIALERSVSIMAEAIDADTGLLIDSRPRILFNPEMKTANFMVPGLVGMVMQLVTILLTAFSVVREKETGTLEQLMVTPVSRFGLMSGKLIPYCVVGAFETLLVVLIMRYLFGVPIAGSTMLLAAFSLVFLFTALGLGLFVSVIAETQMQAVQLAFVIILPSILLSGFIFPQETMPYPIYLIGQLIPVTYFIRILRGIILRGAGFHELWPQAAVLAAMGIAILIISASQFRKSLA